MNEQKIVHYYANLIWLPLHDPKRIIFPPNRGFRILCKSTADFKPNYDALINYVNGSFIYSNMKFNSKIHIHALNESKKARIRFGNKAEFLLMEGWRVIGICRDVTIIDTEYETILID